jgi:hypothetical protein
MKLAAMNEKLGKRPPATLMIKGDAFASTWDDKPDGDVLVGIRLLSSFDKQAIARQAEDRVREILKSTMTKTDIEQIYLESMLYLACAHAICDPNAIDKDHPAFGDIPLESIFLALTESGARYVFDTIQKVEVEVSTRYLEANTEDIRELASLLSPSTMRLLDQSERSTVLRHLRFVHEILADVEDRVMKQAGNG